MLKDTLVIIGGEFGRTPVVEVSGLIKVQNGRDHNNHGFSYVLAGGGVKGGTSTAPPTIRLQGRRQAGPHPRSARHHAAPDGPRPHRLTYRYSGRDFRLTDVAGTVVQEFWRRRLDKPPPYI